MKKIALFVVLLFTIFLLGCTSDLPPEPGDIGGPIGEAIGYYRGYGPHFDVFDDNKQIFFLEENVFNLPPEQDSLNLGIDVKQENGFIYKYGYFYTDAGWEIFQFPEKTISGSNWIKNDASTSLKISTADITPGENYVVSYSCKKYDDIWKCGCSSTSGTCNQWMLQTYLYRNVELPPEPIPPGSVITTRVYISPNGELLRQGNDVNLYVSLDSTKDILKDIGDLRVRIVGPDGTEGWVKLDKFGDVDCNVCEGEGCYKQFICHLSYGTKYTPSSLGEYLIDFGKDEDFPEWMQVNTGRFKIVTDGFFKEMLIEEDIGNFKFRNSDGWYDSNGFGLYASYRNDDTYISVNINSYSWIFQSFDRIKNSPDYDVVELNGNLLYVKEVEIYSQYYTPVTDRIEVVWLSGNKLIRMYINGNNLDVEEFIEAYLEKHPSSGTISEACQILLDRITPSIGYNCGDSKYDYIADVNNDKTVNVLDMIIVGQHSTDDNWCTTTYLVPINPCGIISDTGTESWKVETPNSKLELSENLKSGINEESIADITEQSFISNQELPSVLASGIASNKKGDAPYNQKLYFEDDESTGYVQLTENNEDVTDIFLYFKSGRQIAKYELEFTTALKSDVEGSVLTDFEDAKLTILGKRYNIIQARTLIPNHITLILMGGAVNDMLLEGNSKTYTIDGIDYEVSLDFVDADNAKFTVKGEGTRDLLIGETDKLSNGITIGVSDILYKDSAEGISGAEFFLRADKISLKDSDVTDTSSSNELKANDETIDGSNVMIKGSVDSSTSKIDKITINMIADDDYYVPLSGKLSEQLDEPDLLFTKNWDIVYKGLSNEPQNEINIVTSGTSKYKLNFVDGDGNEVNLPFIYAVGGNSIKLGDDNDNLILQENKVIEKNDFFIVTDIAQDAETGRRKSFALQYKGADKITADSPVLKFKDLGSGNVIEQTYTDVTPLATLTIGGAEFIVQKAPGSDVSVNDFNISIDLNGDGEIDLYNELDVQIDLNEDGIIGDNTVSINTEYGAAMSINDFSADNFVVVSINTPNSDDYDSLAPSPFLFDLKAANGEVRMELNSDQLHNFITPDSKTDVRYAYSSYGAFGTYINPINDPQTVSIEYPKNQGLPMVYVTGKYTVFTTTSTGGGGGSVIEPIEEEAEAIGE